MIARSVGRSVGRSIGASGFAVAGGGPTYLLDTYSGAAAAYSLRRLNTAYTGPVVRVRTSAAGSAEEDFSADEVADGTLASWIGAGNDGFVKTWYDQSGNGNDASQATLLNQPQIVDNGAVLLENGEAAIDFDGNVFLPMSTITGVAGLFVTSVASFDSISTAGASYAPTTIVGAEVSGFVQDFSLGARLTIAQVYFENAGTPGFTASATISINQQYLITGFASSVASFIAVNSVLTTGVGSRNDLIVNAIGGLGLFSIPRMNGTIQELVIYSSNQSSNRTGIESNIASHYGITLS